MQQNIITTATFPFGVETPDYILCHLYELDWSDPTKLGTHGLPIPFTLALFLGLQKTYSDEKWKPPTVIFAYDERESFNGIPVYQIYKERFLLELKKLKIDHSICNIVTSAEFGLRPHDTVSELQMLERIRERENAKFLCFLRQPHQERTHMLAKRMGINADYLSAEEVIQRSFRDTTYESEELSKVLFPDKAIYEIAEFVKRTEMIIDPEGKFLSFISAKVPSLKHMIHNVVSKPLFPQSASNQS